MKIRRNRERPGVPDWIWKRLEEIPAPSAPFKALRYRPAGVKLKDGRELPCTIFFGEKTFEVLWGHYPRSQLIPIGDVEDAFPSPYQLPPRIANKIYDFGETRMGGTDFALVMRDGRKFYYSLGGLVDFLYYPEGYRPQDIRDVEIGYVEGKHERSSLDLQRAPGVYEIFWCLYKEPSEVIKGVLREQPGLFGTPMSIIYRRGKSLKELAASFASDD